MAASLEKSKPWLVMLYLAGDNTLTEEMVLAMQDLLAEGPPRDDRLLHEHGRDRVRTAREVQVHGRRRGARARVRLAVPTPAGACQAAALRS